MKRQFSKVLSGLSLAAAMFCTLEARADILNIDVTGIESRHEGGDPANIILNFDIGPNSHVTGIGWDVTLTAVDPSWRSELGVLFSNSASSNGVNLFPGTNNSPGGPTSYSSGGIIDLVSSGIDFLVDTDGILRLEFFEGFEDVTVDPDGFWNSGTLTVQFEAIPEPGSLGLLAIGAAGLLLWRRQRAKAAQK